MSQPPAVDPVELKSRQWCMFCHLSALAGLLPVIPFGSVLGPLIVWQMKKNEFPNVDIHGKESVNFQLSVLIYLVAGGAICLALAVFCVGYLLLPVLALIPIVAIVLTVIAGIKANNGEYYRYPLTIRLIS